MICTSPPGFDDGFHVVQAGGTADVGRLQTLVNLRGLLELHDLLGCLRQEEDHYGELSISTTFSQLFKVFI